MTGKTHAAVGLCSAAFILVPKVDIKTALIGLGFCVIGSYATDADLKKSKAGHVISDSVNAVSILAILYLLLTYKFHYNVWDLLGINMPDKLKILGVLLIAGSVILGRITGHRKYMHSLLGLAVMTLGVWFIADGFAVWFGVGYAFHIIIDLLNEKPESLLFPLPIGKACLSIAKSRGSVNSALTTIAYIGFILKIISVYNINYLYNVFIK